jgi:RNA polymerase sigma factor (sigma-70 family)
LEITIEIIQACKGDDRKSINRLYEHCFHLLMPVCFRYNQNEEDARAALNQGFLKILTGLKQMEGDFNFNAWARRIMVNSLIDEYRKNKRYTDHISKSDSERELDFYAVSAKNEAESNFGYEMIMGLLEELPESTGIVFKLYVIEGYSHKEIGEQMDISEGTSKWHLSTARKMLRERIEEIESQKQRLVI